MIICIFLVSVFANPIFIKDLSDVNILSSVQWNDYLPRDALEKAIRMQGCQLPKESIQISETLNVVPTWVTPIVDVPNTEVTSSGDNYDTHGTLGFVDQIQFKIDFSYEQNGQKGFGSLLTGKEPIGYDVSVRQNNKTIKYSLSECLTFSLEVKVYDMTIGLTELEKVKIVNKINDLEILPVLINSYYANVSSAFCAKLSLFVQEASLLSKVSLQLESYQQSSQQDVNIIKTIDSVKIQALNFNKRIYTSGLNVEILNFQSDALQALDYQFHNNHLYNLGISIGLLDTFFQYGATNQFYNTIVNSTTWPSVDQFKYKTGDLRTSIPTAYYSFPLNTDINIVCKQINSQFLGLQGSSEENNAIGIKLTHNCTAFANTQAINQFKISIKYDIAVQIEQYINFYIRNYTVESLTFQEIAQFKIWSEKKLTQIVSDSLKSLIGFQTYGSGWMPNQLGSKTSYGFTELILSVWSLSL